MISKGKRKHLLSLLASRGRVVWISLATGRTGHGLWRPLWTVAGYDGKTFSGCEHRVEVWP